MNESREITVDLLRKHLSSARLAPFMECCSSTQEIIVLYEENVLSGLLSKKYEYRHQYWRRCLHRCFPHKPKTAERSQLHDRLNALRHFRNRVAHQERIFHRAPEQKIMQALEVVGWINPAMQHWVQQLLERMP